MSDQTGIGWTDATWNPTTGCSMISEGCRFCYAVEMTKRLAKYGNENYLGLVNEGKNHFNGVVKCHEKMLLKPLGWKKPRRIFVNSMSDLFHKDVPFEFVDKVFAVMALCPQHQFQVLTKRPERMAEYFDQFDYDVERIWDSFAPELAAIASEPPVHDLGFKLRQTAFDEYTSELKCWPLPNVWLGTSVENQAAADERIPHLLRCPAAVRFLSCEPLLGPVDLAYTCFNGTDSFGTMPGISWAIIGGESGPNRREMRLEWLEGIVRQCQAAGVPVFVKQSSGPRPGMQGGIPDRIWSLKEFPQGGKA